jgi:hypothetical protein
VARRPTPSPRSSRPSSSASCSCARAQQAIDFDPENTTIPRLFDEFDRIAAATAGREVKGELPADHDRLFTYSLAGAAPDVAAEASAFRPAFGHLALLLQIPGVDIPERMEAEKGAPLTALEARCGKGRICPRLADLRPERARQRCRALYRRGRRPI